MRFVNIDESIAVDLYAIEAIEKLGEEMLILFGLSGREYQLNLSDYNEFNDEPETDIDELKRVLLERIAEG